MLLYPQSPPPSQDLSSDFYSRMASEGMVQSSLMRGECFEMSPHFDERHACAAVTWSTGGEEHYFLATGRTITIQPSGAITLAPGERYTYRASDDATFRSNMIAFPRWISDEAGNEALSDKVITRERLATRFIRPSPTAYALMTEVARQSACHLDDAWFTEHLALLYGMLLQEQKKYQSADVDAVKSATREQLKNRIDRAVEYMLENYRDPEIGLNEVASAACLSRYHLIRIFKALIGETPMQHLATIRAEAAMRLLEETGQTVSDVAFAVGYSDRTALFRSFRRQFRCSPSSVRQ